MLLDLWTAVTDLFVPVLCSILLLTGLVAIASARLSLPSQTELPGRYPLLFAFGFLGGVPGLIAGMSREPIVGALLTGLLGLMSALLSYLFGKDTLKEWRPWIPLMLIALLVNALGGLTVGGVYKKRWEDFDRKYKEYALEREKVYLEVMKEERLLQLRAMYAAPAASATRTAAPGAPR